MIIIAIAIVVIVCILTVTGIKQQHGGGMVVDVDTMVFSDVESHPEIKNRPITTFTMPLPLETVGGPKGNTSPVVKKELAYLSKLTSEVKPDDDRRKLCVTVEQHGALKIFEDYAGSNGLIYDAKHLHKVARDVETLAYLLKSYHNRPRPYQLGFLLGKNIAAVVTATSSSYPCEHTMISKVLADQLSHNNPDHRNKLHSLAKRIELSRYYGGVNFPSDTVAALKVSDILKDKIAYLDTSKCS